MADLQWGTVGQWVSATATFAAVVVALTEPIRRARFRRPRLRAEVNRSEPFVRLVRARQEIRHEAFFIRVAVWNEGKSSAERVRAHITQWVYRELDDKAWRSHDLDPAVLHWTGMPHVDQGRNTPAEVSIPPASRWFFDLACCSVHSASTTLILDDRTPRGFVADAPFQVGQFVAEVQISAANAAPVTARIEWTIDGKNFVSSIGLVRQMPDAPPGGLLNILRRQDHTGE